VCARFVELCREVGLLTKASVAIGVVGYNVQVAVETERRRSLLPELWWNVIA